MARATPTKVASIVSPDKKDEDIKLAKSLRPKTWEDFIGQEPIVKQLKRAIDSAKSRGELPEHILFSAPPGTGKTTLGKLIGGYLEVATLELLGTSLTTQNLYWALGSVETESQVVLIDEFMKLKPGVPQMLNRAMEDFELPPSTSARYLPMRDLMPFVLVTATTDFGSLPGPLRDRFTYMFHLAYYEPAELSKIAELSAKKLDLDVQKEACEVIGDRARGTPRIANRLLKRLRDFSTSITAERALAFLEEMGIDEYGLDEWDRKYLGIIEKQFGGGPVGLKTLSGCLSETEDTILQIYEPYLMRRGLIAITPRGRVSLKRKKLPWK